MDKEEGLLSPSCFPRLISQCKELPYYGYKRETCDLIILGAFLIIVYYTLGHIQPLGFKHKLTPVSKYFIHLDLRKLWGSGC